MTVGSQGFSVESPIPPLSPGGLLVQAASSSATPELLYSAVAHTEIMLARVVNTQAEAVAYTLYHADDGQSASVNCIIHYEQTTAVPSTHIPIQGGEWGGGVTVKPGGRVYVSVSVEQLTFSLYGTTRPAR